MKELIEYLNNNQGALMVLITFVYVVATIAICIANIKSAKASKEQLEESKKQHEESIKSAKEQLEENRRQHEEAMKSAKEQLEESKRQFNEINRPCMSCEYLLVERTFCCLKIHNYGNKPAYNVTFNVNKAFLDNLPPKFKNDFSKLNSSVYFFAVNQSYDFFFSDISNFTKNKTDLVVEINYEFGTQKYHDVVTIYFEKQLPFYTFKSSEDKMVDVLKEISKKMN